MSTWLLLAAAIAFEVAATVFLRCRRLHQAAAVICVIWVTQRRSIC